MRTSFLLLSTAFVLAACADDQHATAPSRSRSIGSSAASGDMATTQGLGIPQAKPQDEVGFTKVTTVKTGLLGLSPGFSGSATATCPLGTQLISGGYVLTGSAGDFALDINGPNASNGWTVHGSVGALGAYVTLVVTALCIQ